MENEVFISYSRKDTEFALKLRADLEKQGISVWIDQGDIVAGDAWRKQIVEGIEGCRIFLIVLSPHSAVSANVVKELSLAESNRKKIIPILYQPVEIPKDMEYQLSGLQYQAFNEGRYEDNLARLVAVIKSQPVPKVLPSEIGPSTPTRRAAPTSSGISTGMIISVGCAFILLAIVIVTGIFFVMQASPSVPITKVPPTTPAPFITTTAPTISPRTTVAPPPPYPTTIAPTFAWTPTQTPRPTFTSSPTPTRPWTLTPSPVLISFSSPSNSSQLNPVFKWRQGGPTYSSAIVSPADSALIFTGGANADSWGAKDQMPLILYPMSGDFDAQVKMDYSPKSCGTAAGIGVRSSTDNLTWLRFQRGCLNSISNSTLGVDLDNNGGAGRPQGPSVLILPNPIYLRIQRRVSSFTFSYSANGNDWVNYLNNFSLQMPTSAEIFLTAHSWSDNETIQARFYEFRITDR